jgi:hypothetical protein
MKKTRHHETTKCQQSQVWIIVKLMKFQIPNSKNNDKNDQQDEKGHV